MIKRTILLSLAFLCLLSGVLAQTNVKPEIYYSAPRKYTIGAITVSGIKHYEESLLIAYSGLAVGSEVSIPGDDITAAIKKFWKQGLFSDVTITADSIVNDKVYLNIQLQERPRLSVINYHGLKKSEITDLEEKISMIKGAQVTPNLINNTQKVIKNHFIEKGFHNTTVTIHQKDDLNAENQVIIDIFVDKKEKVKIANFIVDGNQAITFNKINRTMKKTNEKNKLRNFFRSKKFITEQYDEDKIKLIEKYNELGYRDAVIEVDSIYPGTEENTVNVYLKVDEGDKYYFRNLSWVGNTKYTSDQLSQQLRIKDGDVYNQKLLNERLNTDDDAISNLYLDNGYLFFNLIPVEVMVDNDSIDLEFRMTEGTQATVNKVIINGNDRTHEQVARRELRVKPGQLFSKDNIIRSVRELAQIGQFDPERIEPIPKPNPEDGTVDIVFNLTEKATDQVELSGGWGAGMFVGTLGLSFNNFSIRNIFNKETYHPLPSGDGQTLSLRAQTNGRIYQSYSLSFNEPWLGGKKPNSLSVSMYHSVQTDLSAAYSAYSNPYYGGYGGYGGYGSSYYGGYGGYGYGNTDYGGYSTLEDYFRNSEASKHMYVTGASAGLGRRLNWPDDFFTLYNELSYQRYDIKDWYYSYFGFKNGISNVLSFTTTLSRNSIDNPIFTRNGSQYSFSVQLTPPYSLFSKTDFKTVSDLANGITTDDAAVLEANAQILNKYVEYHKWKFKGATFTPLTKDAKLILMAKAEFGYLGYYNKYKTSPFEKFRLGGDGMSGYSLYGSETIALRGYENGSLTPIEYYSSGSAKENGNMYVKYTAELRYPLVLETSSTIFALAFLEAGNAWGEWKNFNPFTVKRSAGVGVRIFLPMFGLMGIDWGYGFDKDARGTLGASQFHFVIGQQF
ncbi:outer membrane protein assembly factor [Saccharicrinis sp. FJH62]|uniref:BamA/OMP85 family outer membrane protein n=1 Tax=Saccharicrinis sp. FJH62 TaxID=3344657 RepID=UPI0035D40C9D